MTAVLLVAVVVGTLVVLTSYGPGFAHGVLAAEDRRERRQDRPRTVVQTFDVPVSFVPGTRRASRVLATGTISGTIGLAAARWAR